MGRGVAPRRPVDKIKRRGQGGGNTLLSLTPFKNRRLARFKEEIPDIPRLFTTLAVVGFGVEFGNGAQFRTP